MQNGSCVFPTLGGSTWEGARKKTSITNNYLITVFNQKSLKYLPINGEKGKVHVQVVWSSLHHCSGVFDEDLVYNCVFK